MFILDANSIPVEFMDANESAFFLRELESVKSKTYDTKYKNLKATMLIPVDTSGDSGAMEITVQRFTKVGIAKIISDYASDAPRVDIYGKEESHKVYIVGDSYGWSKDEVRRSMMAGKSLDQRKANAAKRASDEKINKIAWLGDAAHNIDGFLDYPGITDYTIPDGDGGDPEWSTKTSDEILADLNGIVTAIINSTNGIEIPDTMLMPINQYRLLSTKRVSSDSDMTVLQYFLRNNGMITKVEWLTELAGAGAAGADRFIVYTRDSDHLTLEITLPYSTLPPQIVGYGFIILTETKTAGVIVYYPQSVAFGDNI